ncbi:DUF4169 family protein [Pseudotabrizicola formosa]|uniref:DUF4169 family protein n=1 Tax=Pseudotabrizicola formosa TaxID=2030009 RepID=UPI000CD01961|nr:DUF4169 family protein [Pseudotabrizicola formosa]
MGTVVNLRQRRKQKARDQQARLADENAVRFGLTRAERDRQKAEAEKAARDLSGHKREP